MVHPAHAMLIAAASLSLVATDVARARSPDVVFGQRIAERNCGECHAIGDGPSPNRDSPPFRLLYLRYGAGGLDALLAEGMLAPTAPAAEGSPRTHPRMPQVILGEDELAALKAYLHSLEPPSRP